MQNKMLTLLFVFLADIAENYSLSLVTEIKSTTNFTLSTETLFHLKNTNKQNLIVTLVTKCSFESSKCKVNKPIYCFFENGNKYKNMCNHVSMVKYRFHGKRL